MDRRPIPKTLNVSCGPSTNSMCVCIWDKRIRHESLQNGLHKTQHFVNYVVYEERAHNNKSCRTVIPSCRGLRKERLGPRHLILAPKTACILWLFYDFFMTLWLCGSIVVGSRFRNLCEVHHQWNVVVRVANWTDDVFAPVKFDCQLPAWLDSKPKFPSVRFRR